ncbi:MAG: type III-B CRISPR module-associated protein Cmr5 [Thermotogae bacterium]|nr:type III-B CRISPR module-associated protein Cmr5 [Thermotogota bacterium]
MPASLKVAEWAKSRVTLNIRELREEKARNKYKNFVKGLGAMIIQNGLLGCLLFLTFKKDIHLKAVMEDVFEFMKWRGIQNPQNMEFSEEKYLKITSEVLEMNKWLRRYADILIESKD